MTSLSGSSNQILIQVLPEEVSFFESFLLKKNIQWHQEQKNAKVISLNRGLTGYIRTPLRTIHIQPKFKEITLEHVIRLYNYVYVYDGIADDSLLDITKSNQSDNIVYGFLQNLKEQISLGILQDYKSQKNNLLFLKGKVNYKQSFKNILLAKSRPISTEIFQLTTFTPINQLIAGALQIIASSGNFRYEAAELLGYFPDISPIIEDASLFLNNIVFNSKNIRYKKIASDAAMIIDSLYYDDINGNSGGESFLINFDKLFEEFVQKILSDEPVEKDFILWKEYKKFASEYYSDVIISERSYKPDIMYKFNPEDILFDYQPSAYAVLDVKNKAYSTFKNPDVYQLLVYSQLLYAKKSILIYPSFFEKDNSVLLIDNLDLRISEIYATFINIAENDAQLFKTSIQQFISKVYSILDAK